MGERFKISVYLSLEITTQPATSIVGLSGKSLTLMCEARYISTVPMEIYWIDHDEQKFTGIV